MKILLAAGGTGGHINPALSIAQTIRQKHPEWEIAFAGSPNGMEGKLIPAAGFKLYPVEVWGFRRSLSPSALKHNFGAVYHLMTALPRAGKIIKEYKPDIVIGTGGYVSGPIVYMAASQGVKTMIHEQNAFPGVTTKLLSKKVDVVLLPMEKAGEYLPKAKKKVLVGNPVKSEFIFTKKADARKSLGLDDRLFILSCGGSNGAKMINLAVADLMALCAPSQKYRHLHATGKFGKDWMPKLLKEKGITFNQPNALIEVREYIDNMSIAMSAADIVINRAGASTLAELAATGTPAILIPSPNVAENHQYYNAKAIEQKGAAVVITEQQLSGEFLYQTIQKLSSSPDQLKKMSEAAHNLAIYDVCERIYSELHDLLFKDNKKE